jgi:uncharacterized membrane protein YdcZ (DUF606 family)
MSHTTTTTTIRKERKREKEIYNLEGGRAGAFLLHSILLLPFLYLSITTTTTTTTAAKPFALVPVANYQMFQGRLDDKFALTAKFGSPISSMIRFSTIADSESKSSARISTPGVLPLSFAVNSKLSLSSKNDIVSSIISRNVNIHYFHISLLLSYQSAL